PLAGAGSEASGSHNDYRRRTARKIRLVILGVNMLDTGRSRSQRIAAGVDFRQHVALVDSKFSIQHQRERIVSFWADVVDVIGANFSRQLSVGRIGNPS